MRTNASFRISRGAIMKKKIILAGLAVTLFAGGAALAVPGDRFARMDTNGDGAVTAAELQQRAATRFQKLDADRNGSLTQAELQAAHRSCRAQGPARGASRRSPGADRCGRQRRDQPRRIQRSHRPADRAARRQQGRPRDPRGIRTNPCPAPGPYAVTGGVEPGDEAARRAPSARLFRCAWQRRP